VRADRTEDRRVANPTYKLSRPGLEPLDVLLESGSYEMAALLPAPKAVYATVP
jgi:hypothetical protein